VRRNPEQQSAQQLRRRQRTEHANSQPDTQQHTAFAEHHSPHTRCIGAEAHANADLRGARAHREREHTRDADNGNRHRQQTERRDEQRVQSPRRHGRIALVAKGAKRPSSNFRPVLLPLQPLQLIGAITTLYADPASPFVGRQLAFVGARGGVGSSTVAHNLAYLLSETMQTNTVIVDLDLPFGTAGLDFNQDPLQGVADALSQPDRLDPVLLDRMMARCSDRLSLFAAPATLDVDYDISAEAFEEVTSKIRATAPYVVLDLPHLWSGWMRRTLLGADDVVITAAPDLASLRNAKNIVDLVRQARPNDSPPMLVLNMVGSPGRPEIPTKDFGEALGLETGIILPFDAKLFGQAANNGQMIEEVSPKSKAAEAFQRLALSITRRDPPPAAKKSALAGLFKRK